MKILIILMLAALAYGAFRFIFEVFKDLAEMTAEAWNSGDTEPQ